MDIFTELVKSIGAGLNLLAVLNDPDQEVIRIQKELRELDEAYYREKNRPNYNMALLDDFRRRISVLNRDYVDLTARTSRQAKSDAGSPS